MNGFAYGLGSLWAKRLLSHCIPKLLKYCVTAVSGKQAAWRSGVLAYALLGGRTHQCLRLPRCRFRHTFVFLFSSC